MVAEVKPIWSHVLRTGELNDDIGFSIRDQEGDPTYKRYCEYHTHAKHKMRYGKVLSEV